MLDDVLNEDLVVVFCGAAVGEGSPREQTYYGGKRNRFWPTLARTKITPRQFRPEEFELVLAHDIGLTDLLKAKGSSSAPRTDADYDVKGFRKNIASHQPAIVAFNGKDPARRVLGKDSIAYGRQKETFENAIVYVLPATSDRAEETWDEKPWNDLAAEIRKLRHRH